MTITLVVLFIYQYNRTLVSFAINITEFNPSLKKLLENQGADPSFYEQEDAIDLLDAKTVPENSKEYKEVPVELIKFQYLLKPVRLGILSLLNQYTRYISADIRETLNISWGKYTSHLNALEKENLVQTEVEFVDNNQRKVIHITSKGLNEFGRLSTILQNIVSN